MKVLAISATCVICLGLAACAGSAGSNGITRSGLGPLSEQNIDYGKVVAVNQWALRRGATVVWVNYPARPAHPRGGDG
ncbi:MAG: hypothetical protein ACHP7D_09730 [Lysobacterales bacterium]|jgi:hypothetical protein